MPPIRVHAECHGCNRTFKGFQMKVTREAQHHANSREHELDVWQDEPGRHLYHISPTRSYSRGVTPGY